VRARASPGYWFSYTFRTPIRNNYRYDRNSFRYAGEIAHSAHRRADITAIAVHYDELPRKVLDLYLKMSLITGIAVILA